MHVFAAVGVLAGLAVHLWVVPVPGTMDLVCGDLLFPGSVGNSFSM